MFNRCSNSKKKGDAGVGSAIAYFTLCGVCVSIPLTDSQDYDLVIEVEGELKKLQVRTTDYKNPAGNYVVNLKICGGNSKSNFVHKKGTDLVYDYLYVLTSDDTRYLFERSAIADLRSCLTLSKKYDGHRVS